MAIITKENVKQLTEDELKLIKESYTLYNKEENQKLVDKAFGTGKAEAEKAAANPDTAMQEKLAKLEQQIKDRDARELVTSEIDKLGRILTAEQRVAIINLANGDPAKVKEVASLMGDKPKEDDPFAKPSPQPSQKPGEPEKDEVDELLLKQYK